MVPQWHFHSSESFEAPKITQSRLRIPVLLPGGTSKSLDLLQVVQVVAGHGFDDGPEGHGAAFGMTYGTSAFRLADAINEEKVPVAGGCEEA